MDYRYIKTLAIQVAVKADRLHSINLPSTFDDDIPFLTGIKNKLVSNHKRRLIQ